jgi:RNA polymerase sigma-70 factor (ECF subfamily)
MGQSSTARKAERRWNLRKPSDFTSAYDTYAEGLWRHIFLRVNDREETNDLVASVFLKVWEYTKTGKRITNAKAFLYTTAHHAIIDWYRTRRYHTSLDAGGDGEENAGSGIEPSHDPRVTEAMANRSLVAEALGKLAEHERTLIIMRFMDELDIGEIAVIMGKSKGAVAVAVHRSLKSLQKYITL